MQGPAALMIRHRRYAFRLEARRLRVARSPPADLAHDRADLGGVLLDVGAVELPRLTDCGLTGTGTGTGTGGFALVRVLGKLDLDRGRRDLGDVREADLSEQHVTVSRCGRAPTFGEAEEVLGGRGDRCAVLPGREGGRVDGGEVEEVVGVEFDRDTADSSRSAVSRASSSTGSGRANDVASTTWSMGSSSDVTS